MRLCTYWITSFLAWWVTRVGWIFETMSRVASSPVAQDSGLTAEGSGLEVGNDGNGGEGQGRSSRKTSPFGRGEQTLRWAMKLNNEDKIAGEREEREQETKLKRKNDAGQERENDVVNGVINGGREKEEVERERERGYVWKGRTVSLVSWGKTFWKPPKPKRKSGKKPLSSLVLFRFFFFSFFLLNFFLILPQSDATQCERKAARENALFCRGNSTPDRHRNTLTQRNVLSGLSST